MSLCRIGRVPKFTAIAFARSEDDGCFKPKEWNMPEAVPQHKWPYRSNESDRDTQLKQVLDSLQNENSQLRNLVVRLSETIIRNVTAQTIVHRPRSLLAPAASVSSVRGLANICLRPISAEFSGNSLASIPH
jgi:hypothetical protein